MEEVKEKLIVHRTFCVHLLVLAPEGGSYD